MQLQPEDLFALRTLIREELCMALSRPAELPLLPVPPEWLRLRGAAGFVAPGCSLDQVE